MKAEEDKLKEANSKKTETKEVSEEELKKKEEAAAKKQNESKSKSGQIKKNYVNKEGGYTEKIIEGYIDNVIEQE